jgi:ketosteroid isomerase-like protein
MDTESNKTVVRRYIDMWNTGDTAAAHEIIASGYVDRAHPEVDGPSAVIQSLENFRARFPDFHIEIDHIMSEGDTVALRNTMRRTQQGQEVISRIAWFVRIVDGKMTELVSYSEQPR